MSYRTNTRTRRSRALRRLALAAATAFALAAAANASASPSAAGKVLDAALQHGTPFDGLIVKYRDGSPAHRDATLLRRSLEAAATRAAPARAQGRAAPAVSTLQRLAVGADLVRLGDRLDAAAAAALMREIAADPDVEYVEPNILLQPALVPNDPRYPEQWHYFEPAGGLNLPAAWDLATGDGVVVAVLDTGIVPHPDLDANVIAGYDFVSNAAAARDGDGRDPDPTDQGDWCGWFECFPNILPSNSSWHGTHVAGTVAAATNNATGVAGVAFGARIQPVRVLGRGGGALSDISDAIVWASGGSVTGVPANANRAEVINLSLGGQQACGGAMQAAIDGAVGRGSVVVVAAGNSNADAASFTPAGCNNVVTVAATNRAGARASYSNYGATIEVSAPGGDGSGGSNVLSTLNSGTTTASTPSYAFYAGTSMAAPHVAGVAALIQSASPRSPAGVLDLLQETARPLPGACTGGCGAGIVDAAAAVEAALDSP